MYACEMARDGDAHYDIITTFLQTVITTSLSEQFTRGLLTKWLLIAAPRRPPWHLEHVSIVSLPALWARSSDWPLIISCSGWLQRVAGQHGAAMTSHYVVQDCRLRGGNRAYWSKPITHSSSTTRITRCIRLEVSGPRYNNIANSVTPSRIKHHHGPLPRSQRSGAECILVAP